MSPLLGGETQPTIHEDESDDESVLGDISDTELDEFKLNSSTQSPNQTNKTPHKLSNQTTNQFATPSVPNFQLPNQATNPR